ncbi:MAG: tetratricopeptide repeat protein [Bacteroidales bacterium]|nr:tetratricopeptide repeat protein [Bacteroidales bacterium]
MKYLLFISILILQIQLISCKPKSKGPDKNLDTDQELAILNAAISENDKDMSLYLKRAEYFINHQKLNDALADLNIVLNSEPKNTHALLSLSKVHVMMGKPQQALEALNSINSLDPANKEAYLEKAKLYLVMKDYENCALSVEKVLELDPKTADAYYIKGVALDENNEKLKAVEAFRMAVQHDPKHYDALMQLGYSFTSSKPAMAMDYFSNAIKADSSSLEAMYNLGMLYQENEKPVLALEQYARMLKIDPENKLAIYNSGYVNLVYQKDFDKGIDFFSKAVSLDSTFADAYFNRGYSYELKGDKPKARLDYERVLKLRVNDEKAAKGLNRLDKSSGK